MSKEIFRIITNEKDDNLLNFFKEAKFAKEIHILVGYAYTSGFKAIVSDKDVFDNFSKANIKILIGMDFDTELRRMYSNYYPDDPKSDYEIKCDAIQNYEMFCNADEPENKDVLDAFFKKAKEYKLEIRKTKESVHAKLYIFYEDAGAGGFYVTGSSNLTHSGLKAQKEFNISTPYFLNEAKTFFDNLWNDENSVSIFDAKNADTMKNNIGLLQKPTPYEVYLKVLYEYFEYTNTFNISYSPSDAGFNDYKYQIDAIKKALRMINDYNGVLISDVVGLGKSIIGSVVARNLHDTGKIRKIYIICPPALKDQWENYMESVDLYHAVVKSIGQIKNIEKKMRDSNEKRGHLIIIDEAHRFRNSNTDSYSKIKSICQGNKVILLTATPMHNTTSDIFSLVDLLGSKVFEGNNTDEFRVKIQKQEKDIMGLSKEGRLE